MLFRVDYANPCREKAQLTGVCTEGFQRAIADFVRFHCPFVASAEAKSPAFGKDQLWSEVKQSGRAHLARHSIGVGKSSLGGASEEARSYWQGRFAACAFVGCLFELSARKTVGALPQTPQGTLSLDPFRAIELVSLP